MPRTTPLQFPPLDWVLLLLLGCLVGCGRAPSTRPSETESQRLLRQLKITQWDVQPLVGQSITLAGEEGADGSITFLVTPTTKLVTQVSGATLGVIVYVIDSTGVASAKIATGIQTDGLRVGEFSDGVLYRYNNNPVISLTTEKTGF